ncbi:hypothetical protein ACLOJK_026395 [Asimina triloba]
MPSPYKYMTASFGAKNFSPFDVDNLYRHLPFSRKKPAVAHLHSDMTKTYRALAAVALIFRFFGTRKPCCHIRQGPAMGVKGRAATVTMSAVVDGVWRWQRQ